MLETVSLYRCSAECNFFFRSDARNCFSIPMLGRMQLFLSVGCSKLFLYTDARQNATFSFGRMSETVSLYRCSAECNFFFRSDARNCFSTTLPTKNFGFGGVPVWSMG